MICAAKDEKNPVEVFIVAVPETSGSALYGMVDVLMAAGNIWQTLVRPGTEQNLFDVHIISIDKQPFVCGNRIPVTPDCSIEDNEYGYTSDAGGRTQETTAATPQIIILPELWLGPNEDIKGRYPELMNWICDAYRQGASLYSACSGAVMLAETGLLDGCPATSHWGYQDLFRKSYPKVQFHPAPNLVFADPAGHIVTAGGTTSWHDLAIHIIARYASSGEALRIAKVYLLKWHDEGQLPFASLVRSTPHADSVVRVCQQMLEEYYRERNVLQRVIEYVEIPERTLKRRFKAATGMTLIEYAQNLRIEEAKSLLEVGTLASDDISVEVGYEDHSFFRRLFKRLTGLTPSQYRRMFQPVISAAEEG